MPMLKVLLDLVVQVNHSHVLLGNRVCTSVLSRLLIVSPVCLDTTAQVQVEHHLPFLALKVTSAHRHTQDQVL